MPDGFLPYSFPAAISWSIGSLAIRGDDVYAVIGLIAAVVVLTLWVIIENLRLTRWRASDNVGSTDDADATPHGAANDSTGPALAAETDMTPVPARAEWLLDDNTLVRTGAVMREAVRRKTTAPPRLVPAIAPAPVVASSSQPTMKAKRPLRIAMMGSRGIPASYSGFETCVEQLSVRLVERGHSVTVYCRSHHIKWPEKTYKGVRLVKLPTIASKHLDTIAHTFLSMLHGEFRRYDVVYICGVGNGPLAGIPRLAGKPTAINVDGADWEREDRKA